MQAATVIEVEAEELFDLWLQLERLPEILDGVRRVKCVGDRRVLWDVNVAGRQLVWEAELTALERGRRIAWVSRSGTPNRGEIRFEQLGPARTRLEVDIAYEPTGLVERIGARLGLVRRCVAADLERFARYAPRMGCAS